VKSVRCRCVQLWATPSSQRPASAFGPHLLEAMESLSFNGWKSTSTVSDRSIHNAASRRFAQALGVALAWPQSARPFLWIKGITMKRLPTLAFAIGLAVSPILASARAPHEAYAATAKVPSDTAKARAECNQRAISQNLTTRSVRRSHVLRDCMRERGFSGPP
jgi:hypothetical protein